jgi:hypothetical protein
MTKLKIADSDRIEGISLVLSTFESMLGRVQLCEKCTAEFKSAVHEVYKQIAYSSQLQSIRHRSLIKKQELKSAKKKKVLASQ